MAQGRVVVSGSTAGPVEAGLPERSCDHRAGRLYQSTVGRGHSTPPALLLPAHLLSLVPISQNQWETEGLGSRCMEGGQPPEVQGRREGPRARMAWQPENDQHDHDRSHTRSPLRQNDYWWSRGYSTTVLSTCARSITAFSPKLTYFIFK